jgi:hypothetical protein
MQGEDKRGKSKLVKRIIAGCEPETRDLSNMIAAMREIEKLPWKNFDPKAMEVAKKYGLNFVPSL